MEMSQATEMICFFGERTISSLKDWLFRANMKMRKHAINNQDKSNIRNYASIVPQASYRDCCHFQLSYVLIHIVLHILKWTVQLNVQFIYSSQSMQDRTRDFLKTGLFLKSTSIYNISSNLYLKYIDSAKNVCLNEPRPIGFRVPSSTIGR